MSQQHWLWVRELECKFLVNTAQGSLILSFIQHNSTSYIFAIYISQVEFRIFVEIPCQLKVVLLFHHAY